MEQNRIMGNNLTFKTPSGFEVTIREQNGDDDDIISKMKNSTDGSAINRFVASIIISTSLAAGRPSPNDILKWKTRDKYFVLLKSRIFSIGSEILYKHTCSNPDCLKETDYEEDLSKFDRDFSKPTEETNSGDKYQIQPYIHGEKMDVEFTLSSGKKIKYKYLNGLSEKAILGFNKEEISKNTELVIRNIEAYIDEKWIKLENFALMSSKDMMEIRTHVIKNDMPFDAVSECKCPYCNTVDKISLLAQSTFFFPQETL